MTGTDLATPTVAQQLQERPVLDRVNARQLDLIRKTVAQGATNAEIGMFLQLSQRYDLDPYAREIWCVKGRGRNGAEGRLLILVGRDGLLKNADRYDDYRGYDCDVVRANDRFMRTEPDPEAKTLRGRAGVEHTYSLGGPDGQGRGDVIGAWCAAEREGRPPRFFYAALDEYMPPPGKKRDYSPWGSQVSVMIEKVALSVVHRTLCNISGVLVEEETARMMAVDATPEATEVLGPLLEGMPEALVRRLSEAVEHANRLEAESWSAARCQMEMAGRSVDELEALAAKIERENQAREDDEPPANVGGPDDAEAGDAEAGDEHVEDAVVVEDDPSQPVSGAGAGEGPETPSEAAAERVGELQARGRELLGQIAAAEDGSEEQSKLEDELREVEAEVRRLGGESPGQDSLL